MAIAVQLDFVGGTLEQYDAVIERLGLLPGGPAVSQEIFHWVTKTETGFRIVDVWESREAFDQFLEETIRPTLAEVGVTLPPEIGYFEIHNYLAGGQWRR
jgi:hypothetical protein